jgi:hypothetical protein
MNIHRTIKSLEDFGIVKIHLYRAESNRNDDPEIYTFKLPNFYYEIVPVSELSEVFAKLITPIKAVIVNIKRCLFSVYKCLVQELNIKGTWRLISEEEVTKLEIPLLI